MKRWAMGVGVALVWTGVPSCNGEARANLPGPVNRPATSEDHAVADHYVGHYRFIGGQTERDAVLVAIDETVADMNILTRNIARGRLRDSNPVPGELTISHDGQNLVIAFDERSYEAPLDGSSTSVVGITGDTLKYSVSVSAKKLAQTFVGPKGTRNNALRVAKDGTLKMEVEVTSESLPQALRYQLSFHRS